MPSDEINLPDDLFSQLNNIIDDNSFKSLVKDFGGDIKATKFTAPSFNIVSDYNNTAVPVTMSGETAIPDHKSLHQNWHQQDIKPENIAMMKPTSYVPSQSQQQLQKTHSQGTLKAVEVKHNQQLQVSNTEREIKIFYKNFENYDLKKSN